MQKLIKNKINDSLTTYTKKNWLCSINDETIQLQYTVEVTDMYEATGENEYKNYNYVFCIGLMPVKFGPKCLNKSKQDENEPTLYDVISYYGQAIYMEQRFIDTDLINKKLIEQLKINQACQVEYQCRFTKENKTFLHFKTEQDALKFAELLIKNYGDVFMSLIGFELDRPVNLVGEDGWSQIEKFIA